jgi:protein gp37
MEVTTMAKTKIEWADYSINPIRTKDGGYHCTKVSEGCAHCYAEAINDRFGNKKPYDSRPAEFVLDTKPFEKLAKMNRRQRVFVQSMSDLFHDDVPFEFIAKVFEAMNNASQHTFMVLTKRPQRMKEFMAHLGWYAHDDPHHPAEAVLDEGGKYVLRNVWLGVSAENQRTADERIPILLQTPAKKHFVSVEPVLGPVDLQHLQFGGEIEIDCLNGTHGVYRPHGGTSAKLDWVICGCESGPNRRRANIEWIRDLKNQCVTAGVPFFLKQMDVRGRLTKMPELDGQVYAEIPKEVLTMLNPAPELQQAVEAVEVAKNHLDYAQCDKMIDAAVHELRAAELRLSALILERKAGEKSGEGGQLS